MDKLDMSCENCKKHAEHLYWDHMEVNGMPFFKAMTGDFSQQMQLPKNFVNQFQGELSRNSNLKDPGGDTWPVVLTKTRNGIFLQSGWKEFVEAHDIEANDILFFTYVGHSCFDIVIYDVSRCEKTSFDYAKRGSLKRKRSTDSLKNQNGRCQHKVIKCSSSSSTHDDSLQELPTPHNFSKENKKAANEDRRMGSSSRKRVAGSTRFSIYPKNRRHKKRMVRCSGYQTQQQACDDHISKTLTLDHPNIYISRTLPLTDDEQKRALQLVDAVQSDNPCFITVMRQTMVAGASFMTVPSGFNTLYLPSQGCYVLLQVPGMRKKWTVKFLVNYTQKGFGGGWKLFRSDNNLQVGDICFFELISTHGDVVMTVRISRVAGLIP